LTFEQYTERNNIMKKTFTVQGMHCTSCAMVIESDLEDAGVAASCSYAKQTLSVEFDEKKISEEAIHNVVKKSGYTLDTL
jgi:copper chaperone CopZ